MAINVSSIDKQMY